MRPTKLTQLVIETFNEVLKEWHNALVCTDFELCFLLNERLPPESRISYRSFQRYKAAALKAGHQELTSEPNETNELEGQTDVSIAYTEKDEVVDEDGESLIPQMFRLWMIAIIRQKNLLVEHLGRAKSGWSRYRWLLERKFKEWA